MKASRFITILVVICFVSFLVLSVTAKEQEVDSDTNVKRDDPAEGGFVRKKLVPVKREDVESGFFKNEKVKRNELSKRAIAHRGGTYTYASCSRFCRNFAFFAFCNYARPSYCVCFNR